LWLFKRLAVIFPRWIRQHVDGEIIRFNFPYSSWEAEGRSLVSALGYAPK